MLCSSARYIVVMYGDEGNMRLQQEKDRRAIEWDLLDSSASAEQVLTMHARTRPNFT